MSSCANGTVGSIILILTLTGSLSRGPFDTMYVNESRGAVVWVFIYVKVPLSLKFRLPLRGVSSRRVVLDTRP